jgi:hypothetical protein
LTRPSDVQALSNIIGSQQVGLVYLALESIECPVDDCNKQDNNESDAFLDPLLYAASGVKSFWVSTKAHSARSTLVSPRALCALFLDRKQFQRLSLRGLGLTDSHVLVIVDGLSTPDNHLNFLNLESNPGISAQGYGALFDRIYRANVVCYLVCHERRRFRVDDKAWEGKLNLVSEMNLWYRHLEYLTNGTFTSAEHRLQWLEKVVNLPRPGFELWEWEGKRLNFIGHTLCKNPEMMQVSQAPTRTRKRKATGSTSTFSGTGSARTQR